MAADRRRRRWGWRPTYSTACICLCSSTRRFDGNTHAFARIDNLLDRRYVGSVIVNDGNGRYFEPAPGRSFLLGPGLRREP